MMWIVPLLAALLPCFARAADVSTKELLSELPQCARSCFNDTISKSDCGFNHTKCLCTNDEVLPIVLICVSKSCSVKEALTAHNSTDTYCEVPIRNRTSSMIRATITLTVLSSISIFLRFVSKVFLKHSNFGLDDLFTYISFFCCIIPITALTIHGPFKYGFGKDIWTIDFEDITKAGFYFYIQGLFYFPLVSLLKMALLFFYLRIFFIGLAYKLLWGTIIFNAIYGIVFSFIHAFQCTPMSLFWTRWDGEHHGTCLSANAYTWANASISIALDLWMLAIPLWYVGRLNLNWKKKIGAGAMFVVGTFITIVSILRLQSLVTFGLSHNPTYDQSDIAIWSMVEIHVGLICTSMPALRIFLIHVFPVLAGSSDGSRKPHTYGERYQNHVLRVLPSRGESISRQASDRVESQRTFEVQDLETDEARLVTSNKFDMGAAITTSRQAHSMSDVSVERLETG
ncbi:hypothetical protein B0J13DRAFT_598942 [Dactylonectria estremocensis]|uniref:CFEM domain-containing protein n=1 Tax=Dactylonectria estremocensis TaxID=1079267 RepID=A0A9P9IMR9_9HYPO|nr:hypothetical protein B0J13DRAFT_598942 [Dactylonectria estremocensis]